MEAKVLAIALLVTLLAAPVQVDAVARSVEFLSEKGGWRNVSPDTRGFPWDIASRYVARGVRTAMA